MHAFTNSTSQEHKCLAGRDFCMSQMAATSMHLQSNYVTSFVASLKYLDHLNFSMQHIYAQLIL